MQDSPLASAGSALCASVAAWSPTAACGFQQSRCGFSAAPPPAAPPAATRHLFSEEPQQEACQLASAWSSSAAVLEQQAAMQLSPRTPTTPGAMRQQLPACPSQPPRVNIINSNSGIRRPQAAAVCRMLPGLAPAGASELSRLRSWLACEEAGLSKGRAIAVQALGSICPLSHPL